MLTADESTRFLPPQLISAILAISIHAPENTPLVYTADHGLGWQDPRGWDVYFGIDLKDIEMKLLVYDAIVSYIEKEGIQPMVISVEYVHAPYYRVEQ
jgi:cell division protein FtsQ